MGPTGPIMALAESQEQTAAAWKIAEPTAAAHLEPESLERAPV